MQQDKTTVKLTSTHYAMLKCRGMCPKDYEFVKETYGSLYVRNKVTGAIKILNKHN